MCSGSEHITPLNVILRGQISSYWIEDITPLNRIVRFRYTGLVDWIRDFTKGFYLCIKFTFKILRQDNTSSYLRNHLPFISIISFIVINLTWNILENNLMWSQYQILFLVLLYSLEIKYGCVRQIYHGSMA